MRDQEVKQRIRQAFDHMAPELPGVSPVPRATHEEPAPVRRTIHPGLRWAMTAAAVVLLIFCGFAVLHGRGTRPGSGMAASQVPADPAPSGAAAVDPGQGQTAPTDPTAIPLAQVHAAPSAAPTVQTSTAIAVVASREPAPAGIEAAPRVQPSPGPDGLLGEEEVTAIILTHAQVAAEEARQWDMRLEWEDGRLVYEADFIAGDAEFDYEIDAVTGEILKSEREMAWSYTPKAAPTAPQSSASTAASVGRDEALSIAFEHAGVQPDQAQKVRAEGDREDGRDVYEVDFVYDGIEYEYEIDAATGEILKSEREKVKTSKKSGSKPAMATAQPAAQPTAQATDAPKTKPVDTPAEKAIGKEDALSAALQNAGISSGDAGKVKVEKDREDGRTVYEVEFEADGYEYEYEIDAATGNILKKEKERDDD